MSNLSSAAALIACFTPDQFSAIREYMNLHGSNAYSNALQATGATGLTPPLFSFIPPIKDDTRPDVVPRLLLAAKMIILHTINTQPSVDDYTRMLAAIGLEPSFARREVETNVITPDTDLGSFTRDFLSFLPDAMFGPGRAVLGAAADLIQGLLPQALMNRSNDVVYELYRLGGVAQELVLRSIMSRAEISAQTGGSATGSGGGAGGTQNPSAVMSMLEALGGVLLGAVLRPALGVAMPAALPALSGSPALPGVPGLPALPMGDVDERVYESDFVSPEFGDVDMPDELIGEPVIPTSLRKEAGDLINEVFRTEQGGLGSWMKKGTKLLRRAAPYAAAGVGGALGGPVGTALGTVAGRQLTALVGPKHRKGLGVLRASARQASPGAGARAKALHGRVTMDGESFQTLIKELARHD